MLTLLGGLLGLFTGALPELIGLFRDWQDKKHELAMVKEQRAAAKDGHTYKMAEIDAYADIQESAALRKPEQALGPEFLRYAEGKVWPWVLSIGVLVYVFVDVMNRTVRPVLAYTFTGLYVSMKLSMIAAAAKVTGELSTALKDTWTQDDMAIVLTVVGYYLGQRGLKKFRESRSGAESA
ncbi:MAG: hypothetical protein HQL36_03055 [Alphaproteobacteria bacterium]|nr:hypothetical protein [Alphaproteobacteria bacterium]